ncbi:MAG: alpha/beta fold hydrolase [Neisseriaceae bacterium]|nr:alpha/beta fold hydrolase [Neisseriaceae bacterium]
MSSWENFNIQGVVGHLSCLMLKPDIQANKIAILLHPNPLHGGSNRNKVVQTAAKALCKKGFLCVLPNLRGVGESDGEHDYGNGETFDAIAIINYLKNMYPDLADNLLLGGFSFGAYVSCKVVQSVKVQNLLLIGAAVAKYKEIAPFVPDGIQTLFIHGADDEVIPLQQALDWCGKQNLNLIVVPQATHFFHGKLHALSDAINRFL